MLGVQGCCLIETRLKDKKQNPKKIPWKNVVFFRRISWKNMFLTGFWSIRHLNVRFIASTDIQSCSTFVCASFNDNRYVWIGLTATLWILEKLKKSAKINKKTEHVLGLTGEYSSQSIGKRFFHYKTLTLNASTGSISNNSGFCFQYKEGAYVYSRNPKSLSACVDFWMIKYSFENFLWNQEKNCFFIYFYTWIATQRPDVSELEVAVTDLIVP